MDGEPSDETREKGKIEGENQSGNTDTALSHAVGVEIADQDKRERSKTHPHSQPTTAKADTNLSCSLSLLDSTVVYVPHSSSQVELPAAE